MQAVRASTEEQVPDQPRISPSIHRSVETEHRTYLNDLETVEVMSLTLHRRDRK